MTLIVLVEICFFSNVLAFMGKYELYFFLSYIIYFAFCVMDCLLENNKNIIIGYGTEQKAV